MTRSATAGRRGASPAPDQYARRLGALLRRRRRRRSMSVRKLAASGGGLSAADLRAYERGERPVDPAVLQRLCDLYGVEVESVLPHQRAVIIDFERGQLAVGGDTFSLPASDDPSSHLHRYVRAVNRLRSQPMRSPATLRRDDTEALAEALELRVDEVAELLAEVIGQDAAHRRRATALRSGAGTLAAVVVIGAATPAVQSRGSRTSQDTQADAIVLTAEEIAPVGAASAEGPASAPPVAVPASGTVRGPDLLPEHPPGLRGRISDSGSGDHAPSAPGGGTEGSGKGPAGGAAGEGPAERGRSGDTPASDARADQGDDAEVEDETGLADAVTIEREDYEQDQIEDETELGDPVIIEREPSEDIQD